MGAVTRPPPDPSAPLPASIADDMRKALFGYCRRACRATRVPADAAAYWIHAAAAALHAAVDPAARPAVDDDMALHPAAAPPPPPPFPMAAGVVATALAEFRRIRQRLILTVMDKCADNFVAVCPHLYHQKFAADLQASPFYAAVNPADYAASMRAVGQLLQPLGLPFKPDRPPPVNYGTGKCHKTPFGFRYITASPAIATTDAAVPIAASPALEQDAAEAGSSAGDLENFLGWLVANGVRGIGREDSKVALFEAEGGERGLMCEEPIATGEVVLEVPLRLALTDHPGDEESNQLMYEGAPWSVRLACKLLRHKAAGASSPWSAYVRVLPTQVPAPLETFGWEDITGLRYPAAEEALHAADWLRADAAEAAGEQATGGLGPEDFNWALSVVHSRTFANAAPGGGVGVRMLVPLIDMMNHAGDEAQLGPGGEAPAGQEALALGLGGAVVAKDNVRWDLLPPGRSGTGGWAMAVSATRPLATGQELMLSYGERSNDDFFIHYGFVPRANPHDDAVLWADLEAALEWHYSRFGAQRVSEAEAEPLYAAALAAGLAEQEAEIRQRLAAAGSKEPPAQQPPAAQGAPGAAPADPLAALPDEVLRQLQQIKVLSRGRVTEAVMRAFAAVSGETAAAAAAAAAAERAVAVRCAELLQSMARPAATPTAAADSSADGDEDVEAAGAAQAQAQALPAGGLLVDLALLLADAEPRLLQQASSSSSASLPSSPGGPAAPAGAEVEAGLQGDAAYWAAQLRGYCRALLPRYAALLPGEAAAVASAATAAAAAAAAGAPSASSSSISAPAPTGTGGMKSRFKMPPPPPANASAGAGSSTGAGAGPSGPGSLPLAPLLRALLRGPGAAGHAGGAHGGLGPLLPLAGPQRLSAAFRAYKQMVLWDTVTGCGLSGEELAALL
ncbi:hypothetical protein HXX76_000741 [Chlamydomonas incerta]|uniref:SET domain-containing protein n=1 Tax=Chlamydomonas incerta TaxID=51695 RepID=A0A835WEN8_CHLIN|nr:hypothetical protein HXX76_000741 [Chlamydomonas incerta]|eukprot:KAG2446144.1 hypothetical protein HXX76_000741 [Chlamydomonas incerta]